MSVERSFLRCLQTVAATAIVGTVLGGCTETAPGTASGPEGIVDSGTVQGDAAEPSTDPGAPGKDTASQDTLPETETKSCPESCDDAEPCTDDACDEALGECVHVPLADGAGCDADFDGCTSKDSCVDGTCQSGAPVQCPEATTPCHIALCTSLDADSYDCLLVAGPPGLGCEDGNLCTEGDACGEGGTCLPGPSVPGCCEGPSDCDDANPCTLDTCSVVTNSCAFMEAPDGTPCDAPSGCADSGQCAEGQCATGPPLAAGTPCDDKNPCTQGDVCDGSGGCEAGPDWVAGCCVDAQQCGDDDPCTQDVCSPSSHECEHPPAMDGTSCDADSDGCTVGDQCGGGDCIPGPPATCAAPSGPCVVAVCVSGAGPTYECTEEPAAAGGPCEDGEPCTANACDGKGTCDSNPIADCCAVHADCKSSNPCTTGVCQAETNLCAFPPAKDGSDCDDGSLCTLGDSCQGGLCTALDGMLDCDDGKLCTADVCDPAKGCVHTQLTGSCDDSDPCTEGETCASGVCKGAAKSCDDKNPCTSDSCVAGSGCQSTPNSYEEPCFDGPAGLAGQGICKAGTRKCSGGSFGPCLDQTLPQKEICDFKDNDCNGVPDDDGACCAAPGKTCSATSDCCSGVCAGGFCCAASCPANGWMCNGNVAELHEYACNATGGCQKSIAKSTDCAMAGGPTGLTQCVGQGLEEQHVTGTCGGGECKSAASWKPKTTCAGSCASWCVAGQPTCGAAPYGTKAAACPAAAWVCNGVDREHHSYSCDGNGACAKAVLEIQKGGTACEVAGAQGPCSQGAQECKSGAFQCVQKVAAVAETCNAVDEDCNGVVDDGDVCGAGMFFATTMGKYDSAECLALGGFWGQDYTCWTKTKTLSWTQLGKYDSKVCETLGGEWADGDKCWFKYDKGDNAASIKKSLLATFPKSSHVPSPAPMHKYDSTECEALGGAWGTGDLCWYTTGKLYQTPMQKYDSGVCTAFLGQWGTGDLCWTKNKELAAASMGKYDSGVCKNEDFGGLWGQNDLCWVKLSQRLFRAPMGKYDSAVCTSLGGVWGSSYLCWHD